LGRRLYVVVKPVGVNMSFGEPKTNCGGINGRAGRQRPVECRNVFRPEPPEIPGKSRNRLTDPSLSKLGGRRNKLTLQPSAPADFDMGEMICSRSSGKKNIEKQVANHSDRRGRARRQPLTRPRREEKISNFSGLCSAHSRALCKSREDAHLKVGAK